MKNQPRLEEPTLFISDAHLGGFSQKENARIEAELLQLINYCRRKKIGLAVLGDLFDYWMEYPGHVPKLGRKLLDVFEVFNREMGPTLFITGNHDYWTRNHLSNRGFILEPDHYEFSFANRKVMLLHGDGLEDPDHFLDRPFLHRFLRYDSFLKIYQSLLPPRAGITLMKYFSRLTRPLEFDESKHEKLDSWAEKKLENSDYDFILCGHDHIPRRNQFPFGTFINLGTFCKHRTMGFYNNGTISLVYWNPSTQSISFFDTDKIDE